MDKKIEYIDNGMIASNMQALSEWKEDEAIDVDHLEQYTEAIEGIQTDLKMKCEEIPFKKGLHVYLTDPKTDYADIVTGSYSYYDNDEGRKIMEFVWRTLWPNDPIPTEPLPNVEVIPVFGSRFADDWYVCRGWFCYTQEGDTFRKIAKRTGKSLEFLKERTKWHWETYGPDEPFPAEKVVHLRNHHECIERDLRGLYFHELPLKTQNWVQSRQAIQPSGAVCPFDGNWMLTHVNGKGVALITRSFNQGDVLPGIDGQPAQWQLLIEHPPET